MLATAPHDEPPVHPVGAFVFDVLNVQRDWPWVAERVHCHLVEDSGGFVAFDAERRHCAAVVFDSFTETCCCCHIVVENPHVLRRGFLQMAAHAIFVHAGIHVVIGVTPSDNEKALRFNRKVGWQEIYRVRDGYGFGVDLVVQEMRRETCRWLPQSTRHNA